MQRLLDFVWWPIVLLICGSFLLGMVLVSHHYHAQGKLAGHDCDVCHHCKADMKPCPPLPVKDGLALHRWYRPSVDLSWDWRTSQWLPGRAGHGLLQRSVPLFVVERYANAARLRGAVYDACVIVPDGPATAKFVQIKGDLGEIGDLPAPLDPEKMAGPIARRTDRPCGCWPCECAECFCLFPIRQ